MTQVTFYFDRCTGQCEDLPQFDDSLMIEYTIGLFPMRPYGTVAVFSCTTDKYLIGTMNRTCKNGNWTETERDSICQPKGMYYVQYCTMIYHIPWL